MLVAWTLILLCLGIFGYVVVEATMEGRFLSDGSRGLSLPKYASGTGWIWWALGRLVMEGALEVVLALAMVGLVVDMDQAQVVVWVLAQGA